MAADSVGQIGLDLVVNKGSFDKQMKGIQGLAAKAGKTLAAAFAVKKLVDFGAQCIELGSDLSEVQNVVDVTFPRMKKRVDEFAQNAAKSFGLSETMAKRYTGTFGAMAKAFGFNEKAAYDMSTTLTGLAGDVASFYNLSQDEAYTKLKSVFTGETESLKDLGVVMTQAALDQYALANGFGKTTQSMGEAEKVALRYKFVQDQLSLASGDFIRTSDGWANQVRILKLQFESLKATIGQGLINVLTPVIQVINSIIGKLMSLANAFRAFTELITGKKGSGGGASAAAASMEAVAKSADSAGKSMGGAGGAAKKAAKDMKGVTTGIDELNIIQQPDAGGSGGGGGASGGSGYNADEFDMGELDTAADEMDSRYAALLARWNQLKNMFAVGFRIGFGDTSVLDSIQKHLDSIKASMKDIFADKDVQKATRRFENVLAVSLGKIAGSVASVGATFADNLIGGADKYLQQNSERIKDFLISMFDISGDVARITGDFTVVVADVFTVFRSDSAKQITADIIQIFVDGFMGAAELAGGFGRDVLDFISAPIIENSEGFKESLNGLVEAVQIVTSSIAGTFQQFIDGVLKLYEEHIRPLLQSVSEGLSEIVGVFLESFNTYILPVVQNAADQFGKFNTETLQPLIDKFLEFAGKVDDCIKQVWEEVLQPFIAWFIANIAPIIARNLQTVIDSFFVFLQAVAAVVDGVLDALNGLIEFLIGIFTGDWERAWEGIKDFFKGIWEAMKALGEAIFSAIYTLIQSKLLLIKSVWELIWGTVKKFFSDIWNNICSFAEETWNGIKDKAAEIFETVRDNLAEIWDSVKSTIEEKWTAIKEWFSGIWEDIKNVFQPDQMIEVGQNIMNKLWDGLKSIWDDITRWLSGVADFVGGVWDGIVSGAKSLYEDAVSSSDDDEDDGDDGGGGYGSEEDSSDGDLVDDVNGHASGGFPKSGKIFVANEDGKPELIGSWGGRAAVANNMQITEGITRAVQYGMRSAVAPLVSGIAQMAAHAAPPLAMVGGAAPAYSSEERMQEMVNRAVSMAGGADTRGGEYLSMMVDLLKQIVDLIESMDLTVQIDIREIKKRLTELDSRSGYTLRRT